MDSLGFGDWMKKVSEKLLKFSLWSTSLDGSENNFENDEMEEQHWES